MKRRGSLRRRILLGVLIYLAGVTAALFVSGEIVTESAERVVWDSMMNAELSHYLERSARDPDYRWSDVGGMHLYEPQDQPWPSEIASLPLGLHDEVMVAGRLSVILIQDSPRGRMALTEEIREFDELDDSVMGGIIIGTAIIILLLAAVLAFGLGYMLKPLYVMANAIARLHPEKPRRRIPVQPNTTQELSIIADKFNEYLERNEQFIERERIFINSASHELRTPIAVIQGATGLVLEQPELTARARTQMQRIKRTAQGMEQLVEMLLMLGKDPDRAKNMSDHIALDQLLPEIVEDHRHLTRDKDLVLSIADLPACSIVAPSSFVRTALGNLIRNAIENSDNGTIHVRLTADAAVVIEDPGHGMSPEDISRIHARLARDDQRLADGIGLELIARLCQHLGWTLDIRSDSGRGTTARLQFRVHAE